MADSYETIKLSERRDLQGKITPASGTETISAATVSVYDSTGAIAGGVNGAACTDNTSGASSAPAAWYTFCASTLGISPGYYTVVFKITDSNGLVYLPTIGLRVLADSD